MDHGTDYFSCIVSEWQPFCRTRHVQYGTSDPRCRYCTGYQDETGYLNVSEPCPPDTSLRGSTKQNPFPQTTYWSFQSSAKEDDFHGDLLTETGIPRGLTYIGRYNHQADPEQCHEYPRCFQSGWDIGVPMISRGYGTDDVADPKDVIADYLAKTEDLRKGLEIAIVSLRVNSRYSWSGMAMVDALSMPVMMIHQAVESMQQVVDMAEEIEAAKRKQMILLFLSAFLLLVPIGGEIVSAISRFATVGRFVALAGEAALTGVDIYSVVNDPSSSRIFSGLARWPMRSRLTRRRTLDEQCMPMM
ncbi:hypothetical protein BDV59DRAFT_85087 [Aspergillus ambiguus]|uniref:uncharacterized protein n=1 Tax=Aspergillus ambiguus TaxID=176160 RepID=UPI003CCDB219